MKKSIFLCLMIFSGFVNAQTNTALISVDKITLHSDILNEERIVTVHLPDNYYNCEEEYSVLYVFDSPYNLTPVIGLVDHLESSYQSIPNMIVVGLENRTRNRDFINKKRDDFNFSEDKGADNYIGHLKNELIPYIDSVYRTQDFRLIYGHSLSASFGAYLMAKESELIDVCFAVDPAFWADTTILSDFIQEVSNSTLNDNYFYFSHSIAGDMQMISANFTLLKELETNHTDKINWAFKYYQEEDHLSIRLRSLYDGLENYFADCKIPYNHIWNNNSEALLKHIMAASGKYHKISPLYSEKLINNYAWKFIRQNDLNGALNLLLYNKEYYTDSGQLYYLIGEVYEKKGDYKNALINYEKSYSFYSDDITIKNKIEELKNK
jgi:predicted alpha/beta superfamily hydrolase